MENEIGKNQNVGNVWGNQEKNRGTSQISFGGNFVKKSGLPKERGFNEEQLRLNRFRDGRAKWMRQPNEKRGKLLEKMFQSEEGIKKGHRNKNKLQTLEDRRKGKKKERSQKRNHQRTVRTSRRAASKKKHVKI